MLFLIWLVVSTQLKNISQFGSFPQVGVKIKNISNHHLVIDWAYIWRPNPPVVPNSHHGIFPYLNPLDHEDHFFPLKTCDQFLRCSSTKDPYNEGEANLVLHPRKPIAGSWKPKKLVVWVDVSPFPSWEYLREPAATLPETNSKRP